MVDYYKDYVEWKRHDTEEYIAYHSIYLVFNIANKIEFDRILVILGGSCCKGQEGPLGFW